jgi:hypothetical protein
MPGKNNPLVGIRDWEEPDGSEALPLAVTETVAKFLLDGKTGNITLHIKDGVVKCVRAEDIIQL